MWGNDQAVGSSGAANTMRSAVKCGERTKCPHDLFPIKSVYLQSLLKNKHIMFIGDSNFRGLYKDFICLLQEDRILEQGELKGKCEESFLNDHLVFRTQKSNSPGFVEWRQYATPYNIVEYMFTTRCYDETIEAMIQNWERTQQYPDIVIMNSTLWDISRYTAEVGSRSGTNADKEVFELVNMHYARRLNIVMSRMRSVLPKYSATIWLTCPPVASQIVGGFLGDVENLGDGQEELALRVSILDANHTAAQCCMLNNWDVVDIYFYLNPFQSQWRNDDGVHWAPAGYRHMNTLITFFLADAMMEPLPSTVFEYLTSLDIDDPHDAAFHTETERVHPMESLCSSTFSTPAATFDFETINTPSWMEVALKDVMMPTLVLARYRLLALYKLKKQVGLNPATLKRLLLFGDIKSPLEKALDEKKVNMSKVKCDEGPAVATDEQQFNNMLKRQVDAFHVQMDERPRKLVLVEDLVRMRMKPPNKEHHKNASKYIDGSGIIPEECEYDNWVDWVLGAANDSDAEQQFEHSLFEKTAIDWLRALAHQYGTAAVRRLFPDGESFEDTEIKRTKVL